MSAAPLLPAPTDGLRSKSYLGAFWDRLSQPDRWKLIASSMTTSDDVSSIKTGGSASRKDRRRNVSSAASVTSQTSSFGTGMKSSNTKSSSNHDDDDVLTLGSDGIPRTAVARHSSALSVGAASAGKAYTSQHSRSCVPGAAMMDDDDDDDDGNDDEG